MARPRNVYFIKPTGLDGPIKIGCSELPEKRLLSLAVWSPVPLEIIGTVPGTFGDEKFLHECFSEQLSHREWFRASPLLMEAISVILRSGTVDAVRDWAWPAYQPKRRSPEFCARMSYVHRVRWAVQKAETDLRCAGRPFAILGANREVTAILDRWQGVPNKGVRGVEPTSGELCRIDDFCANAADQCVDYGDRRVAAPAAQPAA